MKVLYHGSNIIVKDPLVHIGRKELDFGPGFYLTNLREQDERWARRVCVIQNTNQPYLSRYTLDDKAFANAHCRTFEAYDMEWLDFIVASRRGEQPWKNYDIIEGGVANDQVIDTVEDYFTGRITAEQALGLLRYAKPTHQICINNQQLVDSYLRFEEGITLQL